jgi:hypothetical protein
MFTNVSEMIHQSSRWILADLGEEIMYIKIGKTEIGTPKKQGERLRKI